MIYSEIDLTDLRTQAALKNPMPTQIVGPKIVCLIDHIRGLEAALKKHVHTQECFDYAAKTAHGSGAYCIANCVQSWCEATEYLEEDPPEQEPGIMDVKFAIGLDSETGFTHGAFRSLSDAMAIVPNSPDHKLWRLDPARDMETAVMFWYEEEGEWK